MGLENRGERMASWTRESQVPEVFSDLSPEDYMRLNLLLDDHLSQVGRGCRAIIWSILSGEVGEMNRRLDDITEIAGLESRQCTSELIMSVGLICAASRTVEEIRDKLAAAHRKGTGGRETTGDVEADWEIDKIMRFSILTAQKLWEKKMCLIEENR